MNSKLITKIIFMACVSLFTSFIAISESKASAITNADILGEWWSSAKDARIDMTVQEGKVFGKITWVRPEEENKLDEKNPDTKLRTQKVLGLVILKDFKLVNEDWVDGSIYDPKSGKTYSCKMSLDKSDRNKLNIRGYVGVPMFGRSEVFSRYQVAEIK